MAELRQGGFKSVGEALGSYLNPENSEAGTFQRFAGNLVSNVRELTGTDDESINRHHAGFKAAMALQRHQLGTETLTPEQLAQLEPLAKDWSVNIASNVGAVAPISKAVRAENLAKFMEGSKVVNADGKPLVVYHGMPKEKSNIFNGVYKTGNEFQRVKGAYFTKSSSEAEKYTKTKGIKDGEIQSLYLNIKNPARRKDIEIIPINLNGEEAANELIRKGFDGVIDDYMNEIIVFSPNQIKSATGNRGTFDPNDPNILHGLSVGAAMGSKNKEEKKSGTTVDNYLNQYYKHGN